MIVLHRDSSDLYVRRLFQFSAKRALAMSFSASTTALDAQTDESVASVRALDVAPGLIWVFRVHEDGSVELLPKDKPIELLHDGWLWLHFDLTEPSLTTWFETTDIPSAAIATLLSRDKTQQLHATENCVYGVFADVINKNDSAKDGRDFAHLRFAMTERLLISGRRHSLSSIETARAAIESGARRLSHVASLLELIIEHVADAMNGLADRLEVQLDEIEDKVAISGGGKAERLSLGQLRRTGVKLHRSLAGLRTLFHRLERQGPQEINPALRLSVSRLAQNLDGLDHDIIQLRDRAHFLQDEVAASMAEEANRHLSILAIVTTLFLPPTLISGVYGMNIKGIPAAELDASFWWVFALMVASSGAVYFAIRKTGLAG
jgi:zinc transporter